MLFLHQKEIVHRDFNLLNILIDPNTLVIKLIDFGLAAFDVNEYDICAPEGNFSFRPPHNVEIFTNAYIADLCCLHLIFLSIEKNEKITNKKAIALSKNIGPLNDLVNSEFSFAIIWNIKMLLQEKNLEMKKFEEIL